MKKNEMKITITNTQLAELFNKVDPELKVTEYSIRKARLSAEEREVLYQQLTETLTELNELPEDLADTLRRLAKQAAEAPPLWPSLVGRIPI